MGWLEKRGALIGMIMVQVIGTGLQILSRVILSQGTFIFALLAYRHLLATLCIAPFAFFFERGNGVKLTLKVSFWIFLNSLFGIIMGMGMFYYGLRDTTATYATDFLNLIPIVTFFLSLILRMEKLRLNTRRGKIRLIGAFLCVGGALILTLYKGTLFHIGILPNHHHHHTTISNKVKENLTRGTILLLISCLSYATFYLVQVKLLMEYPSKYKATMLICLTASIQATVVGLCIDRRKSSWMLGWNLQLITILYSGVMGSAVTYCLISWAVAKKGPTYPAMFNPLCLIFTALVEALFLAQPLSLGSVLGMGVTLIGLYSFLWGTRKPRHIDLSLPRPTDPQIIRHDQQLKDDITIHDIQIPRLMMAVVAPEPDSPHDVAASKGDGDHRELDV